MRRSVENAEHVGRWIPHKSKAETNTKIPSYLGLFAPRAGQHFRDEQRRRRSQYDRGTRLAEMEDSCDYEEYQRQGGLLPHRIGGSFQFRGNCNGPRHLGY